MTQGTTDPDGTLDFVGEQLVLRFERIYPNSMNDVWDAITNPARIAQWWLPFDAEITIELVAGGDYILRGIDEGTPTLTFKVLRVEVPRLFEHTHVDPEIVVRWQLAERADGCALVLTQTVPDRDRTVNDNFLVGTHTSLDRLASLLRGIPIAWDLDAFAVHQRRYADAGLAAKPEA